MFDINEILNDANNQSFLKKIQQGNYHPTDAHVGLSNEDLLERSLDENKSVSSFTNDYDFEQCLLSSILLNQSEIKNTLKSIPYGKRFQLMAVFDDTEWQGDDPVDFQTRNKGYRMSRGGQIDEVTTNAYAMVLEKNSNSPYGVKLVTFYPNLDIDEVSYPDAVIKKTNRDLMPDVKKNPYYLNQPIIGQANCELRVAHPDKKIHIHYIQNEYVNSRSKIIIRPSEHSPYEVVVQYKNHFFQQIEKNDRGVLRDQIRNPNSIKRLKEQHPDFAKASEDILKRIDKLWDTKQQNRQSRIQQDANRLLNKLSNPPAKEREFDN